MTQSGCKRFKRLNYNKGDVNMKNLLNFIKLNWFNMFFILVTDVIFPYIISKFEFNETINLIILIVGYILKTIIL